MRATALTIFDTSQEKPIMSFALQARLVRASTLLALAAVIAGCGSTSGTNGGAAVATTPSAQAATTAMAGMNHSSMAPQTTVNPSVSTLDAMAGMDHSGGMAMDPVAGDGTTDSAAGYTLHPTTSPTQTGTQTFAFTVNGPDGAPIKDAVVEQTKKLHLIVVRSDLTGYQHLHPDLGPDGTWTVSANFATGGRWRAIADLTPTAGTRVVLGTDISIQGTAVERPVPPPALTTSVDGYGVALDGELTTTERPLRFAITKVGKPATDVTEYLGAGGHLVALNSATLAYTHLHPNGGPAPTLSFDADAPAAGQYRLFLQFATGDTVHTAEFTVTVTK
jgi:hypothetical protein